MGLAARNTKTDTAPALDELSLERAQRYQPVTTRQCGEGSGKAVRAALQGVERMLLSGRSFFCPSLGEWRSFPRRGPHRFLRLR